MKRILVPTDYSPLCANALDFAIDLALASGAEIHLVHFLNVPIEPATFSELLREQNEVRTDFVSDLNLEDHQRQLKEMAGNSDSQVKIRTEIGGSGVVNGSKKYVSAHSIDLIVLGADDVEEEKGEFPITVSQELTQFVEIPVISLTEPVDYADLARIVLGVDTLKHKNLDTLGQVIGSVLSGLEAEVHLIDVIRSGEVDPEELADRLTALGKAAKLPDFDVQVLEHENDLEGLLLYADQLDAGLVAVVSDGRPNIFRFFKDSFATSVVKATDLPVLVFNHKK